MNVRLQYEAIIWLPINLSTSVSPLWPPDGVIMAILVLFFIVGVHLFLLILGIYHAIFFKIKKFNSLHPGLLRIICQVLWFRVYTFSKLGIKDKATKLLRAHLAISNLVPKRHILNSYALNSDDMDSFENVKSFNSDSQSCICNNSANTHI